ncbi:MAG TPA: hypothetical protein VKF15_01305 [Nitrososphaerales archaeon]|nr:hypothetical protein [Nitrososphaerales archaeon]
MSPLGSIRKAGESLSSSLRLTASVVAASFRHRRPSELAALAREGSPLDQLIEGVLSAAFWVLVLAPVLIVPAYFLLMSL